MTTTSTQSSTIRLHQGSPSADDATKVIFLPNESAVPPHLAAVMAGVSVSEDLSRNAFDMEGQCICLLGVDQTVSTRSLRLAAARLVKMLPSEGESRISLDTTCLTAVTDAYAVGRALAEGLLLAMFDNKLHRGTASMRATNRSLEVQLDPQYHEGFREGLVIGHAVNNARQLTATPPNFAGPTQMAAVAKELAKTHGMTFSEVDAKMAAELGMGGLLAVGAGSADPPRLVILEWSPDKKSTTAPVLLVGKSVTFDSGGYSIKPDGGKGMKADKAGACTMLGVMEAIAITKTQVHVVCILAIAENMIDANAYRLDDVITHCNGVTCEVTNTDAEGRLILADALAWGTATYQPRAVIDAATLTGGVILALGRTTTGFFCNNPKLSESLRLAALEADENIWQLPLDDELRKKMRSNVADLQNSPAERTSLASVGAAYLSYFVGANAPKEMPDTPWVHLDIAGTATSDSAEDWNGLFPKGPTGWGVRTLFNLLRDMTK